MDSNLGAERYKYFSDDLEQPSEQGFRRKTLGNQNISLRGAPGENIRVDGISFGETAVFSFDVPEGTVLVRDVSPLDGTAVALFLMEGEALVSVPDGRVFTVGAGTAWAYGHTSSFEVTWLRDGTVAGCRFPQGVVSELGIGIAGSIIELSADVTLLRPVSEFIAATTKNDQPIPAVAALFTEQLLHDMLNGLFVENHGASIATDRERRSLYERASVYAAVNRGEQWLTPEAVAKYLNVSLRRLQREYRAHGQTVAGQIRSGRLELAVSLLSKPETADLSLDEIAKTAGFSSVAHLRRTFQAAGLARPRDLRGSSSDVAR